MIKINKAELSHPSSFSFSKSDTYITKSDIIHPSIVCNHFTPFMGSQGFLLEPVPAVSGRGQGTPWTSRQLITGPSLMAEAAMQGANRTLGAIWGPVSCSRTVWHAAKLSPELGLEAATFRSLADLLYPLSYSRPELTSLEAIYQIVCF